MEAQQVNAVVASWRLHESRRPHSHMILDQLLSGPKTLRD